MKPRYTRINKNSHSSNHHTFVCSLCYPFALELGSIYGGGYLIYMMNLPGDSLAPKEYSTGKFALLRGQGHSDDETIIFEERPRVDKGNYNYYYPNQLKMQMSEVLDLAECAKKYGGWNEKKDGSLEFFVISKLDALISRWEKKYGKVDDFYKTFVEEREIYLKDRNEKYKKQLEEDLKKPKELKHGK